MYYSENRYTASVLQAFLQSDYARARARVCDNCGVVKSPGIPKLMLMMKHNAIINYHTMREAVVADILRVGKKDSKTNLADVLTKVIVGQKRWEFCFHVCLCVEMVHPSNSEGFSSMAHAVR
jgi:limonene-1,2-epoxide hydrolase